MSILSKILVGSGANTSAEQKRVADLAQREKDLGDSLVGALHEADRTGVWNPDAAVQRLQADTSYQTGIDSGNAAAAARNLGYRPGDSEPLLAQNALGQRAALAYADQANNIRTNSILGRLSAYGSVSGQAGGLYGNGASLYGNVAQLKAQDAASQGNGIGSLLGSIAPFLIPGGGVVKAAMGVAGAASGASPLSSSGYTPGSFTRAPSSYGATGFSMPTYATESPLKWDPVTGFSS